MEDKKPGVVTVEPDEDKAAGVILSRLGGPPPEEVASQKVDLMNRLMEMSHLWFMQKTLSLLQNSMPFVENRAETKRRLGLIQELCAARAKLESENEIFGLMHVQIAVEALINGDWKEVKRLSEDFTYDYECKEIQERYGPKHAIFKDILKRAYTEVLPSKFGQISVLPGGKAP